MALKAGYKGIKEVGPGLDYDNTTGLLTLDGESSLKLDNLEDVTIDTPLGGDVLQYDSSNEEWTNETPDTEPIEDSPQLITSGAVYAGLKTEDDKISAIWSSNARTGVHNEAPYPFSTGKTSTSNGVTFTEDGGIVDVDTDSTTPTGNAFYYICYRLKSNKYAGMKLTGCPANGGSSNYQICCRVEKQSDDSFVKEALDNGEGCIIPSLDATTEHLSIYIRIASTCPALDHKKFYILIKDASDTVTDFTPPAMTNGELTKKVSEVNTYTITPKTNVTVQENSFAKSVGNTFSLYLVFRNTTSGTALSANSEVASVAVDLGDTNYAGINLAGVNSGDESFSPCQCIYTASTKQLVIKTRKAIDISSGYIACMFTIAKP